jgi:hypothetical protein
MAHYWFRAYWRSERLTGSGGRIISIRVVTCVKKCYNYYFGDMARILLDYLRVTF